MKLIFATILISKEHKRGLVLFVATQELNGYAVWKTTRSGDVLNGVELIPDACQLNKATAIERVFELASCDDVGGI